MYKRGDVRLVDPPCEDEYEEWEEKGEVYADCEGKGEGHVHSLLDCVLRGGDKDRWFPPCAYLPHACDEWVIGGPEEVKALIEDLSAALVQMGT